MATSPCCVVAVTILSIVSTLILAPYVTLIVVPSIAISPELGDSIKSLSEVVKLQEGEFVYKTKLVSPASPPTVSLSGTM